jgi:hypothetical protein
MWLTANGEQELDRINRNQLTEEELEAVKSYDGFREVRNLAPNNKGPGPQLIKEIQDILKKYSNYTDPSEE